MNNYLVTNMNDVTHLSLWHPGYDECSPKDENRETEATDFRFFFSSTSNQPYFPPVALWPYSEVQPVATSDITLYQQFVEWLLRLVADVQQDDGIAQQLFHTQHADVYGTPRQVVRRRYTTHCLVHLWTAISTIDDDGHFSSPRGGREGVDSSFSNHPQRRFRFFTCASLGTFSILVFVLQSSASVKCSLSLSCLLIVMLFILFRLVFIALLETAICHLYHIVTLFPCANHVASLFCVHPLLSSHPICIL